MSREEDIAYLGATQIQVGLSAIIQISPIGYEEGWILKYASGGSLEIVTKPPALTGTSAVVWGTGYLMGTAESITAKGPTAFWLAAKGATAIAHMIYGQTSGATTT